MVWSVWRCELETEDAARATKGAQGSDPRHLITILASCSFLAFLHFCFDYIHLENTRDRGMLHFAQL